MDQNMDKMDGDMATKQVFLLYSKIKALVKEQKFLDLCIVGHSSDDNEIVLENFIKNGADCFERKPMNLDNLKNIIKKLLT